MNGERFYRRTALAASLACALALPLAAQAQSTPTDQQLAQRVSQLEQEVLQLKQMLQERPTAPPPTPTSQQASTAPPAKPVFSSAPGVSVAMHGFASVTATGQSKSFSFGNGQNAEWPVPGSSGSLSGFDVRNSRFWFDITGAKFAGNWEGGGRIEMDFFGGFNGSGPFSQQQPTPRLRQYYMNLINPATGTTARIGQQWDLMFPIDESTASLSHVAFPLGFATGMIGWRFPGVVVMQDLNSNTTGPKWRLDMGVFTGSWNGPGNNVDFLTAGNAGFRPQVEARLHVQDKDWLAFFAAHYSKVDLRGVDGTAPTPIESGITSVGYELGGQWKPGPWVFRGAAYGGNGLGEIFGAMAQFGDINEHGGYAQAGYSFTPNWTALATYATVRPDTQDVITWMGHGSAGRLNNEQGALGLQYSSGPYAFELEFMHDKLNYTTNGIDRLTTSGNQVNLSAIWHF